MTEKYGKSVREIQNFLEINFEKIGYSDSIQNHDRQYMSDRLKGIVEELKFKIRFAIHELELHQDELKYGLAKAQQLGFEDHTSRLELQFRLVEENVSFLRSIEAEFDQGTGTFLRVQTSYETGFFRGIDDLIISPIKEKRIP